MNKQNVLYKLQVLISLVMSGILLPALVESTNPLIYKKKMWTFFVLKSYIHWIYETCSKNGLGLCTRHSELRRKLVRSGNIKTLIKLVDLYEVKGKNK